MSQLSFWEPGEGEPIHVRDTVIGPASARDVDSFCIRFHYTRTGGNRMWRWGLWHRASLLGVVSYNLPPKDACYGVFGAEHAPHVWHMGRLALSDLAPRNSESRLIAGSLRAIESEYPHVWAVVTYASPDVGHVGYVYQATNAIYTGTGGHSTYFVDQSGARRPHYQDGKTITAELGRSRGWELVRGGAGKHRYVYLLGNKRERRERRALLRYPVLPYPKAAA